MTTPLLSRQQQATSRAVARGFALYVGISEDRLEADTRLSDLVNELRNLVADLAPEADTHATVALAPEHVGGRDIDVVRLALADPSAKREDRSSGDPDRAHPHVTIDLSRKQVLLDSYPVKLTFREFELLRFFVLREGLAVTREEIIETLWADTPEEEQPTPRTIDVQVRRLRIKLGKYQDIIRTVRGAGYRFDRHADVKIVHSYGRSPDRF